VPYQNDDRKATVNINLKLKTVLDSIDASTLHVDYLVFNVDSVNQDEVADSIGPQNTAKFPGGPYVWSIYLERNLRAQIPSDHRAPYGNYTVIVSFRVDENGKISDVRADNNPGYGTAEEAVRVIEKSPDWQPAIRDGKNVASHQRQNITFQVSRQ